MLQTEDSCVEDWEEERRNNQATASAAALKAVQDLKAEAGRMAGEKFKASSQAALKLKQARREVDLS